MALEERTPFENLGVTAFASPPKTLRPAPVSLAANGQWMIDNIDGFNAKPGEYFLIYGKEVIARAGNRKEIYREVDDLVKTGATDRDYIVVGFGRGPKKRR